jgi:hypothetical protein
VLRRSWPVLASYVRIVCFISGRLPYCVWGILEASLCIVCFGGMFDVILNLLSSYYSRLFFCVAPLSVSQLWFGYYVRVRIRSHKERGGASW